MHEIILTIKLDEQSGLYQNLKVVAEQMDISVERLVRQLYAQGGYALLENNLAFLCGYKETRSV